MKTEGSVDSSLERPKHETKTRVSFDASSRRLKRKTWSKHPKEPFGLDSPQKGSKPAAVP